MDDRHGGYAYTVFELCAALELSRRSTAACYRIRIDHLISFEHGS
jgi:hypothetical protein